MNQQSFDLTTKKGRASALGFLNSLIMASLNDEGPSYNDIHLIPKDFFLFIEWEQTSKSGEWGARFESVDEGEDEFVAKRVSFPDGTYEIVPKDKADETLTKWLQEHPQWKKDENGHWYDSEKRKLKAAYEVAVEKIIAASPDVVFGVSLLPLGRTMPPDLLARVPEDVSWRTQIILIDPDYLPAMAGLPGFESEWESDNIREERVFKAGTIKQKVSITDAAGTRKRLEKFDVFCVDGVGDHILFLTDSFFPIYRLDIDPTVATEE